MKTHYNSQIGDKRFFWIQHAKYKFWLLMRVTDKGKFVEQKIVGIKNEMPEDMLMKVFRDFEHNLLVQLESGQIPPPDKPQSKKEMDEYYKKMKQVFEEGGGDELQVEFPDDPK